MPKVKDDYRADKRNFILECIGEILKEKPLYLITMRDIINRAGCSQGAIYRYYANLDEIYVDFLNKHTTDTILEQKIDTLLDSKQSERTILAQCIVTMGEYIEELLASVFGRAFFELLILYSSDSEKRSILFPQLKFRQSLEYAQNKTMEFALINMDKGVFRPQIPVTTLLLFVSVFMDGIAQNVVSNAAGGGRHNTGPVINITEMFETLAEAVLKFLDV